MEKFSYDDRTPYTARELIEEWIKPSPLKRSPLYRHGRVWWRESFKRTGFISARVREHPGRAPEYDIQVGNPDPTVWDRGLYRVQNRVEYPKFSWWNGPEWALQHFLLLDPSHACIVAASTPEDVYATITYERVTADGEVEIGSSEVIAEVSDWEKVGAEELLARITARTHHPEPRRGPTSDAIPERLSRITESS